jgi:1-acyl-sn-glycerol-3-phosphate acyltransferase
VIASAAIWLRLGLLFFPAALVLWVASFLWPRRDLDEWVKRLARLLCEVGGYRVAVHGAEHVGPGPYAFMVNHSSLFDHFVAYGVIPHCCIGLEKAENFRIPIYGSMMRRLGIIPIRRQDAADAWRGVDACVAQARAHHHSICVAPEGTRSADGTLGPFKRGVFEMARALRYPIVPVALVGVSARLPKGALRFSQEHDVQVRFGAPIPVTAEVAVLQAAVRDSLLALGVAPRTPL